MGRRKKFTNLKLIENSCDRRHPMLISGEPLPSTPIGSAPAHFSFKERGTWDDIVKNAPRGMLKALDRYVLEAFVEAWETRRQAQEKLRRSPMVIRTPSGSAVPSPYVRIVNQQTVIIKSLIAELGFSPAARTSIAIEEEPDEDPTDRFFR